MNKLDGASVNSKNRISVEQCVEPVPELSEAENRKQEDSHK